MNRRLAVLQPYPFERLRALHAGVVPAALPPISLSIGEPQHAPPPFVLDAMRDGLGALGTYPTVIGSADLRAAAAGWLARRFALPAGAVDPDTMVLPVAGTREALYSFAQAVIDAGTGRPPLVVMPNPCYQIYEGAALLAGAEPYYLDCRAENGFRPDLAAVPAEVWDRCQLLYLCTIPPSLCTVPLSSCTIPARFSTYYPCQICPIPARSVPSLPDLYHPGNILYQSHFFKLLFTW